MLAAFSAPPQWCGLHIWGGALHAAYGGLSRFLWLVWCDCEDGNGSGADVAATRVVALHSGHWQAFGPKVASSCGSVRCRCWALLCAAHVSRVALRANLKRHGLRASEVTGFRLIDLDLATATIYCRRVKGSRSSLHPLKPDEIAALDGQAAAKPAGFMATNL